MVGWHHQLNGHEFEQTLGDGEAQRSHRGWQHPLDLNLGSLHSHLELEIADG